MDIGLFQLLPAPGGEDDAGVVARALSEADRAEALGFDSVWIAEHHLSDFGLVGAPSVYAAAVAQRTRRIDIGYAVAVVPLHHPVRLAEEIAWLTHLSRGRVLVGMGPGFSPLEFGAYGVPLEDRHERFEEGASVVEGLLSADVFEHRGRHWTVPPVRLRPRPWGGAPPPFFRASSSAASLSSAAERGRPLLLGLKNTDEIARSVAAYRGIREGRGVPPAAVEAEIARFRVLRRVVVADEPSAAEHEARRAFSSEARTATRVHEGGSGDAPVPDAIPGSCIGTPETVAADLSDLEALGIRHVIAWINFGDMAPRCAERSMALMANEVLPAIGGAGPGWATRREGIS